MNGDYWHPPTDAKKSDAPQQASPYTSAQPDFAALYSRLYTAVMAAFGGEIDKALENRHADPFLAVAADVLNERASRIRLLETISSSQSDTIRRPHREANKSADTVDRMAKAMSDAAPGLWFQAGREAGNDLGAVTRRVFELVREQAGAEAVQKARIKAMQVGFDRHDDYADLAIRLWKNPPADATTDQKAV